MSAPDPIKVFNSHQAASPIVDLKDDKLVTVLSQALAEIDEKKRLYDESKKDTSNIDTGNKGLVLDVQRTMVDLQRDWINAMETALSSFIVSLSTSNIKPSQLPLKAALHLADLLTRYGISLYGGNGPNSFGYSLNTLKTSLLLFQYALKLRDDCPDLSKFQLMKEVYTSDLYTHQANMAIAKMDKAVWASRIACLSQQELITLSHNLRYINGALRYLQRLKIEESENLIETAAACLIAGKRNADFSLDILNNEYAELLYNDKTGLLAQKREALKTKGNTDAAKTVDAQLSRLWDECVFFSSDKKAMHGRCLNKRPFVQPFSPSEELEIRNRALEQLLASPMEQRNWVLLALAYHNLSHAYEAVNNKKDMLQSALSAMQATQKCKMQGSDNFQLDLIIERARLLIRLYDPK